MEKHGSVLEQVKGYSFIRVGERGSLCKRGVQRAEQGKEVWVKVEMEIIDKNLEALNCCLVVVYEGA